MSDDHQKEENKEMTFPVTAPRESLSPIVHRKSSIQFTYNQQQYTPSSSSTRPSFDNSSVHQNDGNFKTTVLSENTITVSDNPFLFIDSTNDDIIPGK